jgi:5-formyltetrahydrofolate cyclo-ligase
MSASKKNKSVLRQDMRARLADNTVERLREASIAACARVIALDAFRTARIVMLYMPLASEIDVTPVALRCFQLAKTVCVPRVDWQRKDMIAIEVNELDDRVMDVDEHGIRVPRQGQPVLPSMIDLVVAPGLAFDTRGHRLGRGGGFYDRFLARMRESACRVGVAFDFQVVDAVPAELQDASVDIVVTDRRVTTTRPLRSARGPRRRH